MDIRKKQVETHFTEEAERIEIRENVRDPHIPLHTDPLLKELPKYHLPHSFTCKQAPF